MGTTLSGLWSKSDGNDSGGGGGGSNSSSIPLHQLPKGLNGCINACCGGVVFLAGCGGGCDIFGTAMFLHRLQKVAKDVVLVSLTHTDQLLLERYGERVTPYLYRVDPGVFCPPKAMPKDRTYFPEAVFSNAVKRSVYVLSRHATVAQIVSAYYSICTSHQCKIPRAVFLVDGGCDVLLTGDETGLGTPAEDMLHLRAITELAAEYKAVLALGVNVDCGHGVVQSELDDRLATLRKSGKMLFEQFLTLDMEEAAYYNQVVSECLPIRTVVQSLVKAAIEGHRGYYTENIEFNKAGRSVVPITDQTATLFGFDLHSVAADVKYLSKLTGSSDMQSVCEAVQEHRAHRALKTLSLLKDGEGTGGDASLPQNQSVNKEGGARRTSGQDQSSFWWRPAHQKHGFSAKEILGNL